MGVRVIGRLAEPRPEGEQDLAFLVLGIHGVVVLRGGFRINQAHLLGLVIELQRTHVNAILVDQRLSIRAVGIAHHVTGPFGIAIERRKLEAILHGLIVPILEQTQRVDVIAAGLFARLVLHLLEDREQILKRGNLGVADLLVVIPTYERAESRFDTFAGLGRRQG